MLKGALHNNFGDRKSTEELFDDLRATTFKTTTIDFFNDIKTKLRRLNNKAMFLLGEGEGLNAVSENNI